MNRQAQAIDGGLVLILDEDHEPLPQEIALEYEHMLALRLLSDPTQ